MSQIERKLEEDFISHLKNQLKYEHRKDIKDLDALEQNFKKKFEELNKVHLSDGEFRTILQDNITKNVFEASKKLRQQHTLERDDGTILYYHLVDTDDWCKNSFEVIQQLRINTKNSYQRYDVILLINGLPLVQVELKNALHSPRMAIKQIIDYKRDIMNTKILHIECQ